MIVELTTFKILFYLFLISVGFVLGTCFGTILGIFLTSFKDWTRKIQAIKWVYNNWDELKEDIIDK